MASDLEERKHRRSSDDESEEPSKRRKHRHHHHRRRHHRHRHHSRKHDSHEDKREEGEEEATDMPPPPFHPPSANLGPDYDMEEGEIVEEDDADVGVKKTACSDAESGEIQTVELAHGGRGNSSSRDGHNSHSSGRGSHGGVSRRSDYRVLVTGLPSSASWQDLKDHMRRAGDV